MTDPPRAAHLVALAAAMALGVMAVVPGLARTVTFDASYAYLPMAQKLLAQGAAYLHRPESIATAPLAYAWPALFGAAEGVVRIANVALYAATIALAFATLAAVHSARAAVIAAILVAASPVLHPFIPDVMTEPPFVFLCAIWLASIAAVMRGHFAAGAVAGGLAFALATFTRPATMWFPLLAAVFFAWRAWRANGDDRRVESALALMHAVAAVAIGILVARNALEFGYAGVATGAGNALFHGVNSLVDGFDPTYYGLTYDDGAATRGGFHLAIAQDRLLRATALEELRATPMPVILEMWARKAAAFVLVTPQEWGAAALRSWRVVLAVFAVAAFAWGRRSPMHVALALFTGYLVAVHTPIFYLHRYSAALELPMALLAAIGFAEACATTARFAAGAMASVLATGVALAFVAGAGPASPHPDRSPHELAWSHEGTTVHATRATHVDFTVAGSGRLNPSAQLILALRVALLPARGGTCQAMRVRYRSFDDRAFDPARMVRVPLIADGRAHDVTIGAFAPLRLNHEGVLRLEFECEPAATVEIGTMTILEPLRASFYRQRYLERLGTD